VVLDVAGDAWDCIVRAQRMPKYPNTNKMITTAPTSQTILFMVLFLPGLIRVKLVRFGHSRFAYLLIL